MANNCKPKQNGNVGNQNEMANDSKPKQNGNFGDFRNQNGNAAPSVASVANLNYRPLKRNTESKPNV